MHADHFSTAFKCCCWRDDGALTSQHPIWAVVNAYPYDVFSACYIFSVLKWCSHWKWPSYNLWVNVNGGQLGVWWSWLCGPIIYSGYWQHYLNLTFSISDEADDQQEPADPVSDRKFIVFEGQLNKLLTHRPDCGAPVEERVHSCLWRCSAWMGMMSPGIVSLRLVEAWSRLVMAIHWWQLQFYSVEVYTQRFHSGHLF